ncbi:hypothetical protein WDZ17_00725 [Pseudokineococcus basanitobsidens]|uniref:Uncharacterized protein n=1 Tax=Pseudokineococcus basanitobsidens TaxID=1926649 RepID=A0ABU8RFG3_9ACTN
MSSTGEIASLQHRIQQAVISVMVGGFGLPRRQVGELLARALADAGIPDQPAPWMRTAAAEIAVGRLLVLNTAHIPDYLEHAEPDPETHATG